MTADLILFFILAGVAVTAALGMLLSKSAVYSALFLILNFITVAVFYLILGAPLLAMTQVTVYAGAIMVLFLFVIMLLGAEKIGKGHKLPWQMPLAILLAVVLIAETAYIFIAKNLPMDAVEVLPEGFGSPESIGDILYTKYLLPFEITSVLLLVAMIGAIFLTRKKKLKLAEE